MYKCGGDIVNRMSNNSSDDGRVRVKVDAAAAAVEELEEVP